MIDIKNIREQQSLIQDRLAKRDKSINLDNIISAASKVMMGTKLPEDAAANAVAHGGVDMAPNAGKKKKDKEKLMARRGY